MIANISRFEALDNVGPGTSSVSAFNANICQIVAWQNKANDAKESTKENNPEKKGEFPALELDYGRSTK